jgi:hypothetical protein
MATMYYLRVIIALAMVVSTIASADPKGWVALGVPNGESSIHYDPTSLHVVEGGFKTIVSVINYLNEQGQFESLVSASLYDCQNISKLDHFTNQHRLHWGDGEVITKSGVDEQWRPVKPKTNGMLLFRVACK